MEHIKNFIIGFILALILMFVVASLESKEYAPLSFDSKAREIYQYNKK